jgi:RNAse (barnase) inhibitor barstar
MAFDENSADFRLAQNGFVTLFWQPAVLEVTLGELADLGYRVVTVDAASWASEADLHRELAALLEFPDYYGENLDALNDCVRQLAEAERAFALVLWHYDRFRARNPLVAHTVLDIVADQGRVAALTGHKLLCLVQSDDPDIRFAPVGATSVNWNDLEWLEAKRHPD